MFEYINRICINNNLPEIKKFAGPILQAIIVTLTRETPLEARAFSPDRWKEDGSWKHWRDWGQFAEIEMKRLLRNWRPNLKLKWFSPSENDFNAMQELINYTLSEPLNQINQFINEKNDVQPKVTAEQLLEYVRVLYHFCYGLGHLGDFDVDKHSQLLPTIKEDNYFTLTQNENGTSYYNFSPPKDKNDKIYGKLNKLRSILKLPNLTEYENVSIRTAFTRLAIKLYSKLGEYSDTSDYVIDASELPGGGEGGENQSENGDVEMSDSSFSNINLSDIFERKEEKKEYQDDETLKSLTSIKKSKLFPGVSKVLVWLNTFVNIMMNHDGVMWGVVANYNSSNYGYLRSWTGSDIMTGHKYTNRPALVNEAHALTLKRLYFLFNHNSYTTDVRSLVEQLVKCSISEFQNVRKQAIHAIISGRSIYNFRSAIEWAFRFWLKIIKDCKSQKCQLLGATKALNNNELMGQLILRTSQRNRDFICALFGCSIHREPLVQSAVYNMFFTYFNAKKYQTIYLPPNMAKDDKRKKEIVTINENLQKEYQLLQQELVRIAKNENNSTKYLNNDNDNDNDSVTTESTVNSDSFVKIPSTPDDPVVSSLSSLINNLDLDSLNIDFNEISKEFDINNLTTEMLSKFLSKQGFNLPSEMFNSLSREQLQAIIDNSKLAKYLKQKIPSFNIDKIKDLDDKINKKKETVNVHWKYQLMASILLWESLRPNIAPNKQVIEYMLKLIGNEIPTLNRVAITSLCLIVHNYLPLLHYKNVIKTPSEYPKEHTFGWIKGYKDKININNLYCDIPLYMRPKSLLSCESASVIHEYLAKNLDVLFKAFADDHPLIIDPSAPRQNRRSSDTQLRNLIQQQFLWPYDGYDVTINWWEERHYILTKDILRCKWPNSDQDTDIKNWKYDENLWILAIDQFNVNAKNIKEKENQLAAGEILAGILRAYHQFAAIKSLPNGITTQLLTNKIVQPMLKIMQQCPQESAEAWCSAIRAGIANSDPNNIEWFTQPILKSMVTNLQIQHSSSDDNDGTLNKKEYISADKQVRAMRYGTEILLSYGYRGEKEWRYVLSSLTKPQNQISFDNDCKQQNISEKDVDFSVFDCFFSNTYRPVRGDIGILLGQIVRCLRIEPSPLLSKYDCTNSDQQFTSLLTIIESQYIQLWNKQQQEQIKRQQKGATADEKEQTQSDDDDKYTKKYNQFLQTLVCKSCKSCHLLRNFVKVL